MTGPCCPPLSAASRPRRSRLDINETCPWHWTHFAERMGATSAEKDTAFAGFDPRADAWVMAGAGVWGVAGVWAAAMNRTVHAMRVFLFSIRRQLALSISED